MRTTLWLISTAAVIAMLMLATSLPTLAVEGTLTIAGSTTVRPLAEELGKAFAQKNPGVKVMVQGGGTGQGIENVRLGVVDIGMASRGLTASEREYGLEEWVIAVDAIAVVVNRGVSVDNLALEQIEGIFSGRITDWDQVGGRPGSIIVVNREDGSGTRGAFQEMVLGWSSFTDRALIGDGNGVIHKIVSTTPNAIGYLSLGYADSRVKAVTVDGVEASIATILDGSYKVSRPLLMLTRNASDLARAFLEFALGPEGQKIVASKYIPVGPAM
jgi:phosphate transport system substrate-binding protein